MERKLVRPLGNKVFAGVCGALGIYFGIDPVIVRVLFVVAFFTMLPAAFLAYVILAIVIPRERPDAAQNVPAQTETAAPKPAQQAKGTGAVALSVVVAVLLILAGLLILLPGSAFRFLFAGSILIAVFLVFIAGKLFTELITGGKYHFAGLSAAFITLSLGVFILLNRFGMVGEGIFIEYAKNLIPAALIVAGIVLIFRNVKNKAVEIVLLSVVFAAIGGYSLWKGNYSPLSSLKGFFSDFRLPRMGRWMNGGPQAPFAGKIALPAGAAFVHYRIVSSAGTLKISPAASGPEYRGTGIAPVITTHAGKAPYQVEFDNQASDTELLLPKSTRTGLNLNVSAGEMRADLAALSLETLEVSVNGGSLDVVLGQAREVKIKVRVGQAHVRLPKNATIRIRTETSLAQLEIPREFIFENGEYVYKGGPAVLNVSASAALGQLEFSF